MGDFAKGDRIRLSPTSPNIRLHNYVGDAVGTIVRESNFKAWHCEWKLDHAPFFVMNDVHEHEIEKVTDV